METPTREKKGNGSYARNASPFSFLLGVATVAATSIVILIVLLFLIRTGHEPGFIDFLKMKSGTASPPSLFTLRWRRFSLPARPSLP